MLMFVTAMMLVLSACTYDAQADLLGVYRPLSISDASGEYEIEDEELHIEEGGKGYFILHDTRYEIRWKLENGNFYFEDSSGDEFRGFFKDKIIDGIYFNDIRYVFSKDK